MAQDEEPRPPSSHAEHAASAESDLQRLLHGDASLDEGALERIAERYPELSRQLQAIADEIGREGAFDLDAEDLAELDLEPPSDILTPVELGAETQEVLRRLRLGGPHGERYREVGPELGRGGMGVVRHVQDADLNRKMAMKVLHSGVDALALGDSGEQAGRLERFLEEAQITAQLDHPGIVPVHELGLGRNGQVYFTMKVVKGQELSSVFERVRARDPEWSMGRALDCLLRVCEAMAYAHAKGVIHRDLKPANVMVGRFGAVYVMDWGLAMLVAREQASAESEIRVVSPGAAEGDGIVGSLFYMSPEQARGENAALDQRTDVYAFGAMLYELLVGHPPYSPPGTRLSQSQVLMRIREGPPPSAEELAHEAPLELCAIVARAMAHRLDERYADMSELARDLRAYLEGRVVRAHATGAVEELRKWVGRNRGLAAALVLSLGLATVLLFSLWSLRQESRFQAQLEERNQVLEEQNELAEKAIDDLRELEQAANQTQKRLEELNRLRLEAETELGQAREALELARARTRELVRRADDLRAVMQAALVPWTGELERRAARPVADLLDGLADAGRSATPTDAGAVSRIFVLELVGFSLLQHEQAVRARPHLSEAMQLRRRVLPMEERQLFSLTLASIRSQIRGEAAAADAEAKVAALMGEAEKLAGRLSDPDGRHAAQLSATRNEVAGWRRERD